MKSHIIHFLDPSLNIERICDDHVSLTYTEEFAGAGDFMCVLSLGAGYVPSVGDFVLCDGRLLYVVDSVARDTGAGTVKITGRGALSLLSRRIIPNTSGAYGRCDSLARTYINRYGLDALPAPVGFVLDNNAPMYSGTVNAGSLLEALEGLSSPWKRGISLDYSPLTGRFTFSMKAKRDRRLGSESDFDAVFLAENFGTLTFAKSTFDKSRYANSVTVRGAEKDDGTHYSVTVDAADMDFPDSFDDSASEVREGYVASGIGVGIYTTRDENNVPDFDEEAYLDALRMRGRQYLAVHRPTLTVEAGISPECAADIVPGDVCTLCSDAWDGNSATVIKKICKIEDGTATYFAEFDAL